MRYIPAGRSISRIHFAVRPLHCSVKVFYTQGMVTLHEVTVVTRKFLAICAMGLIGILLIVGGVRIFQSIKGTLYPTPPPPPTVSYGKLPSITFPQNITTQSLSYTVNTITGTLPNFPDRTTIHKITPAQPNLLALKKAQEIVQAVGFKTNPIQLSDVLYAWTNTDTLPKTLTMNIQTQDFTLTSDYKNNQDVLSAQNIPDQTQTITTITSYLNALSLFPPDIDDNRTKVSLFAISQGQLVPATSLSTTQIERVDLFQKDIDKMPIFYAHPSYSSMNVFLGSADIQNAQIVAVNFSHKTISFDSATYPIKSASQALKDLQNGNGYIASYTGIASKVIIQNISLGYFMSDANQAYLMPIVVFQGDNNFFAYVSAVRDEWLSN